MADNEQENQILLDGENASLSIQQEENQENLLLEDTKDNNDDTDDLLRELVPLQSSSKSPQEQDTKTKSHDDINVEELPTDVEELQILVIKLKKNQIEDFLQNQTEDDLKRHLALEQMKVAELTLKNFELKKQVENLNGILWQSIQDIETPPKKDSTSSSSSAFSSSTAAALDSSMSVTASGYKTPTYNVSTSTTATTTTSSTAPSFALASSLPKTTITSDPKLEQVQKQAKQVEDLVKAKRNEALLRLANNEIRQIYQEMILMNEEISTIVLEMQDHIAMLKPQTTSSFGIQRFEVDYETRKLKFLKYKEFLVSGAAFIEMRICYNDILKNQKNNISFESPTQQQNIKNIIAAIDRIYANIMLTNLISCPVLTTVLQRCYHQAMIFQAACTNVLQNPSIYSDIDKLGTGFIKAVIAQIKTIHEADRRTQDLQPMKLPKLH